MANPFVTKKKTFEAVAKEVSQPNKSTPQQSTTPTATKQTTPSYAQLAQQQTSSQSTSTTTQRRSSGGGGYSSSGGMSMEVSTPEQKAQVQATIQREQQQQNIISSASKGGYGSTPTTQTGVQALTQATNKISLARGNLVTNEQLINENQRLQRERQIVQDNIIKSGRTTIEATPQESQKLSSISSRQSAVISNIQKNVQQEQQAEQRKADLVNAELEKRGIKEQTTNLKPISNSSLFAGSSAIGRFFQGDNTQAQQIRKDLYKDIQLNKPFGYSESKRIGFESGLALAGGTVLIGEKEAVKAGAKKALGYFSVEYGSKQVTKYAGKVAPKVATFLENPARFSKYTRAVAGTLYQAPKTALAGIIPVEGVKAYSTYTSDERKLFTSDPFKELNKGTEKATLEYERKNLGITEDSKWYQKAPQKTGLFFADQLGLRPLFSGWTGAYEGQKKYYMAQGLTEAQANEAVKINKRAELTGIGSSFLINAGTEIQGRGMISSLFEGQTAITGANTVMKTIKYTAPAFITQGAIEASSMYLVQNRARNEEITFKGFATQAGLGSFQATALGVPIGITSIARKSASPEILNLKTGTFNQKATAGTSRGLEYYSNIVDYAEKPGDIIGGFAISKQNALTRGARNPIITLSNDVVSFGSTTKENTKITTMAKTSQQTTTQQNNKNNMNPFTMNINQQFNFNEKQKVNTNTNQNIKNVFDIPINNNFGVPNKVPSAVTNIFNINQNIPEEIQTNIPVNTNTAVSVPFNVVNPTGGWITPPMPLVFPSGNFGSSRQSNKKGYVNELSRALGILGTNKANISNKPKQSTPTKKNKFSALNALKYNFKTFGGKGGKK